MTAAVVSLGKVEPQKPAKRDSPSFDSRGRPSGSGVTEAAYKTLFTQRFKQSGMKWFWNGGQPIINLRTILLSGLNYPHAVTGRSDPWAG